MQVCPEERSTAATGDTGSDARKHDDGCVLFYRSGHCDAPPARHLLLLVLGTTIIW